MGWPFKCKTENETPIEEHEVQQTDEVINSNETTHRETEIKELKRNEHNASSESINQEDFDKMKETLEIREKEIEYLKKKIDYLTKENEKLSVHETKYNEQSEVQKLIETIKNLDTDLQNSYNSLVKENKRLQENNEELLSKLDSKQERLEEIMRNCQEDRYRKDKHSIINSIIYQLDLMRKTIYDVEHDVSLDMLQQLKGIMIYMDNILKNESIECIQNGIEGSDLDLEKQEVIETATTDNPELNGKICRSVNPGYVWKLPYILKAKINDDGSIVSNYRYLIRPEQVITYKYNN